MLLKNCRYIITQDKNRKILKNSDILIQDEKIKKIGKNLHSPKSIDFSNKVVMPGMINTHTHLPMTLFRGYFDNLKLQDWLATVMEQEAKLTAEDVYYGTLLGCLEAIQYGTTTLADFYYYPYERVKALELAGLNGFLDSTVVDTPFFFKDAQDAIDHSEKFIKDLIDHPTIKPIATAHSIYLCSKETLLKIRKLSDKYNVLRRVHVSETQKEFRMSLKKYKKTPIEFIDSLGWLNKDALLVHANWATNKEIRMIAKKDAKICHNPISNMKLAYGKIMPLKKMLDAGVTVSLATDGPTSNNNLDLFGDLKLCSLANKFITNDPRGIDDQKLFDLANREGAKTLRILKETGSIEPGKLADLITIDYNSPHLIPINRFNSLVSHIIYSVNGSDIIDTMVRGKFLMKDRKFLTLDKDKIIDRVQKLRGDK